DTIGESRRAHGAVRGRGRGRLHPRLGSSVLGDGAVRGDEAFLDLGGGALGTAATKHAGGRCVLASLLEGGQVAAQSGGVLSRCRLGGGVHLLLGRAGGGGRLGGLPAHVGGVRAG